MKLLLAATCIIVLSQTAQRADADRTNGAVRKCGSVAEEFLQWFCMDKSFRLPLLSHSNIILVLSGYRFARDKGIYPFVRLTAKCCMEGCLESDYKEMCNIHDKIQRCERRHLNRKMAKKFGRRRRFCRMNPSLLI